MRNLPSNQQLINSIRSKIQYTEPSCVWCNEWVSQKSNNHLLKQVDQLHEYLHSIRTRILSAHCDKEARQVKTKQKIINTTQLKRKQQKLQVQKKLKQKSENDQKFVPHRRYESGKNMKQLLYNRMDRFYAVKPSMKSCLNYDYQYNKHEQRYNQIKTSDESRYATVQSKIKSKIERDKKGLNNRT